MKNKREEKKEEEKESFYDVLGVKNTRDLSEKTLERAYKKCALKYHPDRPNGNAEKFLRCTKAFETLKDTNLKAIISSLEITSDNKSLFACDFNANFGEFDLLTHKQTDQPAIENAVRCLITHDNQI